MLRIVTRRWVEAILASDDAMGHIRRESYYMRAEDYIEDLAAHGGTDGTRFKTTYLTTTTRGDIEFTQVAKDYWAKIGVDVELDVVDQETMMSHWNNHTYEGMAMGELGTDCCPSRS